MSTSLAAPPRLLTPAGNLELTLWGEAGHRPVRGIEGIASVVMNRARLAGLPDGPRHLGRGVAGICRAPFQFGCWHPKHPRHLPMQAESVRDDPAFAVCRRVAARALAGALPDGTGGATHYHGVERLPRWAIGLTPTAERGGVAFYRLLG